MKALGVSYFFCLFFLCTFTQVVWTSSLAEDNEDDPHHLVDGAVDNEDEAVVYDESAISDTQPGEEEDARSRSNDDDEAIDDGIPQYFLMLSPEQTSYELNYKHENKGKWRDRVLLEILYFSLQYGSARHRASSKETTNLPHKLSSWDIHRRMADHCTWFGVVCNDMKQISEIKLSSMEFTGTLPGELKDLSSLRVLDLKVNMIQGTIPNSWGALTNLQELNLASNSIVGTIPNSFSLLTNLQFLSLINNQLTGTIPSAIFQHCHHLNDLELSDNRLSGKLPSNMMNGNSNLTNIVIFYNAFTGTLPQEVNDISSIQYVDLSFNQLTGSIPTSWMKLSTMTTFIIKQNKLTGTIPTELLQLTSLNELVLSDNRLTGPIPRGDDEVPGRVEEGGRMGGKWGDIRALSMIQLQNNSLTGTLPVGMCYALANRLIHFEFGFNRLSGTLPSSFGHMTKLMLLNGPYNQFSGTLPQEMKHMNTEMLFNFTANRLHGNIPSAFCASGPKQRDSHRYRLLGCDMILCPGGTFHPDGASTKMGACRHCDYGSRAENIIIGRTTCPQEGVEFVHGDGNADGVLSEREILRLLYAYNIGHFWGGSYYDWGDPFGDACELPSVTCYNGMVGRIDLADANLCGTKDHRIGPISECMGIPSELALLTRLETLTITRRQYFRGTIPTELGNLTKLKSLEISNMQNMRGTIPSELGRLIHLKYLNLGGCRLTGTIPEELYQLTRLEKLHLSMNLLTGTVSSTLSKLKKVKEVMMSRTMLRGQLPAELGSLQKIENLEMYGNQFTGSIPEGLGKCTNLKRIDLFNNKLTGTIPVSLSKLTSLQILHVKLNQLTGSIPSHFGELPFLSWFDVSSNKLTGTIPPSFGASTSIKDFRLGSNMIYEPIPSALCNNNNLNGGLTPTYGCDGVICSLGTYSDQGHAIPNEGCKACPPGKTTMYLGSNSCESFSDKDVLSIFYRVMGNYYHPNSNAGSESVCSWNGISCDASGEISSIQFSMDGILDEEDLFHSI